MLATTMRAQEVSTAQRPLIRGSGRWSTRRFPVRRSFCVAAESHHCSLSTALQPRLGAAGASGCPPGPGDPICDHSPIIQWLTPCEPWAICSSWSASPNTRGSAAGFSGTSPSRVWGQHGRQRSPSYSSRSSSADTLIILSTCFLWEVHESGRSGPA
jgi:hypothetical protein